MALFQTLLATLRPREAVHPYFGRMVFMKMPAGIPSYWETECAFGDSGHRIEVCVDTPEDDEPPNEAQVRFLTSLAADYDAVFEVVLNSLRPEFERHLHIPFPQEPQRQFHLTGVDIPPCLSPDERWALYFDSPVDEDHAIIANMMGRKVVWIQIGA